MRLQLSNSEDRVVDSYGSVELREHGLQLREGDRVITREPLESWGMEDFLQLCHISITLSSIPRLSLFQGLLMYRNKCMGFNQGRGNCFYHRCPQSSVLRPSPPVV